MASTANSKVEAEMREFAKFVDDSYFPSTRLPEMSVFAGAWGYDQHNDVARMPAMASLQSVNVGKPRQNATLTPSPNATVVQSNNISPISSSGQSETYVPKKKILKSSHNKDLCAFCKNNGESEHVYLSHVTKDKRDIVRCPRLRGYTCSICGETGDKAHTLLHCPKRQLSIFCELFASRPLSFKAM